MKVVVNSLAWVEKDKLTQLQLEQLRHSLTVVPKKVGNHPGDPPDPIPLYVEHGNLFGMAREYYLARRKPEHEVEFRVTDGDKSNWTLIDFAATLRPEQTEASEVICTGYEAGNVGAMVQAAPGWGKTVFACHMISRLQVPTLVVVHKQFLMDQWKERIEQFLPDAKVGFIQGEECDFQGKHVVLAMVHSLSQRGLEGKYPIELQRWPGLVIVDECHRIGAGTWAPVPGLFPSRYRLGITATPRRKDGAADVFFHHLGPIRFVAKEQRLQVKIRRVWTKFRLVKTEKFNPGLLSKPMLLRFVCASVHRNKQIVDQIILAAKTGRKCLVLSERLDHLTNMEKLLIAEWRTEDGPVPTTGQYVGGMKEEAYEESKKAQVIFATSQLVSEGFDLPALDTLFLTTPMSDVEQAVGRIQRPCEGKKEPVVVDIRDDSVPYCAKVAESRDNFYKKVTVK